MNNHIFTAISSTKIVTFIKSSQSRIILVAPFTRRNRLFASIMSVRLLLLERYLSKSSLDFLRVIRLQHLKGKDVALTLSAKLRDAIAANSPIPSPLTKRCVITRTA